jgi:hypothetical protein
MQLSESGLIRCQDVKSGAPNFRPTIMRIAVTVNTTGIVKVYVVYVTHTRAHARTYCDDLEGGDCRWGLDWIWDLLTTCIHHSLLQITVTLFLIFTQQITPR